MKAVEIVVDGYPLDEVEAQLQAAQLQQVVQALHLGDLIKGGHQALTGQRCVRVWVSNQETGEGGG